ncbi:hypothetical protein [Ochrobactrum quorumnocens]|uniref:Uncharacterized protein n=1 Tax=Ochrobactrum quorumnocens TaxID=271865 RepID=A0A5N1JP34_9HYPH|nr:hypothetical protein [[Ochrobactrum] quorumnocens]KAA9361440.1 hypothetical protein F3W84_20290 [[Ochrobactrum] quorumnocens]
MICVDDKRFSSIGGIGTYEAAGGAVKRDPFDEGRGGYATVAAVLEKLSAQNHRPNSRLLRRTLGHTLGA